MKALPGWAIIEPENRKEEGGLFLPDSAQTEIQRGTIVDLDARMIIKDGVKVEITGLSVGMRVAYKKYFDADLDIDHKKYKVVPIEKIMVIL